MISATAAREIRVALGHLAGIGRITAEERQEVEQKLRESRTTGSGGKIGQPARMLSRSQVKEILGIHLSSVIRLEKEGLLPPVKIGKRSIRYRQEDVNALIEPKE